MNKHSRTANISREMFKILSAMPVVTTIDEREKYSITEAEMETALKVVGVVLLDASSAQMEEAAEQMKVIMKMVEARKLDGDDNDSH